jgi:hypothetical protein
MTSIFKHLLVGSADYHGVLLPGGIRMFEAILKLISRKILHIL